MRRRIRIVLLGLLVLVVGIQLVPVDRSNPPEQGVVPAPAPVLAVLQRSCFDCHSNQTRWPWYTEVSPMSWFVANHVTDGRRHLNYSEWDKYPIPKAAHKLEEMCEQARGGDMPLPSYLWIHRGARLSPADIEALCTWTTAARAALVQPAEGKSEAAQDGARESEPH